MKRLSHRDLQTVLTALLVLHTDLDAKTLPQRTIEAVEKIIPGNVIFFDGFGDNGKYTLHAWANREDLYLPEGIEIFEQFFYQHPFAQDVIGNKIQSAVKVTDYVTQSKYERTELYNEYYRVSPLNRQMGLALPVASDLTIACTIHRWGKDYTERDRSILTLIAPYLGNCINNSFAFERLKLEIKDHSSGIIAVDLNGKIQFVNEFARELLAKYFTGEKMTDKSLPENLWSWTRQQDLANKKEFELPSPPLKIKNADGELTIRLIGSNQIQERTLLLEEKKFLCPGTLEQLGLTRREAEILFWIAQGKTDGEIGTLLFISPRTVHKHAENIYVKLGVETRTAAMLRALDALRK